MTPSRIIETAFAAGWEARTPVAWPNMTFSPPNNKPGAYWLRLTVQATTAGQASFGGSAKHKRENGLILMQAFGPQGVGSGPIEAMAREAAGILEMQRLADHLRTDAATVRPIGEDGKGWYQVNVSIPYTFDEFL